MGLAVSGLVGLALGYAGPGTYATIARDSGFAATATFRVAAGGTTRTVPVTLDRLLAYHAAWTGYVTGRGPAPDGADAEVFTASERAHMADVRRVFVGAQLAAAALAAGALAVAIRALRRGRRAGLVLIRDAAIAAGVGVAVVAVAAAVAFDPLFLLFHALLFPQGNFLFPADSNLLALYPDEYWYGVTLRVGLTFVALMAVIAVAATATRRVARR